MRIYNIRTTILRLFLACYMIGLTYFSLRPAATGDAMAASVSWGLHVIAYAVFGILVGLAFPRWFERNRIRSILVIVAFGFVMELIQLFIAGRSFSWMDVGMNAVGASFSWFVPLVSGYLSPGAEEDRNQQIERPDRSSRQAGDLEEQ